MIGFVGKLTNEEGVAMGVGEIDEAVEKDGMFSCTTKVSLLVHDLPALTRLTMGYGPVGVEVEEPHESIVSMGELQTSLMTISAMAQDLTQFIIKKQLLDPAEKANFEKQMVYKALIGQKLMEKAKKDGAEGNAATSTGKKEEGKDGKKDEKKK